MATSLSQRSGIGSTDSRSSEDRRGALGGRLKISRAVSVEILYRDFDQKIPPRVDCRTLFLGSHLGLILETYKEAVRLFSEIRDPAELVKRLEESAEIQKVYESGMANGKVCLRMRDSVFRKPGPVHDLEFSLRILAGKRILFHPVPLERFGALGNLFPLLLGRYAEHEIKARLRSHSSLLLQSERSAVLVDPVVSKAMGGPWRAFDLLRERFGAICCSHSHWDHCHLQTLLWVDKDTPILIPKVREPSALSPPVADALARIGFTDVREVEPWVPVRVDDIEVVPIPFHGEQDEPDFEMDHYTYVLKTKGLSLYGGVDCYRSTSGDMRPVLERVARLYSPDVAFLPVSKWICHYRSGGVNGFCRYLDQEMLGQSFQYTASPADAADWSLLLGAQVLVPYATFTFARWKVPPEVVQFGSELRRRGIGSRFYPLRPLDSLTATDLGDGQRRRSRRWALVAWARGVGGIYRVGRRTGVGRAYRYLRRAWHI
jgi:L-ascorbate metabolism protein UlaG (beta-lactamase superfamily)